MGFTLFAKSFTIVVSNTGNREKQRRSKMLKQRKGETVGMVGFTGMNLGIFVVEKADKNTITVINKKGVEMIFDRATGIQVNPKDDRYANRIGEPVAKPSSKAPSPTVKTKAVKDEVEVDEVYNDGDEKIEAEPVKPTKGKGKKATPAKKVTKKEEVEFDDDDFEYDDEEEDYD